MRLFFEPNFNYFCINNLNLVYRLNNNLSNQNVFAVDYSYFYFDIFLKYVQNKSGKHVFCFFKKENIQSNALLSDLILYLTERLKRFQLKIGKGFFLTEFFESLF